MTVWHECVPDTERTELTEKLIPCPILTESVEKN